MREHAESVERPTRLRVPGRSIGGAARPGWASIGLLCVLALLVGGSVGYALRGSPDQGAALGLASPRPTASPVATPSHRVTAEPSPRAVHPTATADTRYLDVLFGYWLPSEIDGVPAERTAIQRFAPAETLMPPDPWSAEARAARALALMCGNQEVYWSVATIDGWRLAAFNTAGCDARGTTAAFLAFAVMDDLRVPEVVKLAGKSAMVARNSELCDCRQDTYGYTMGGVLWVLVGPCTTTAGDAAAVRRVAEQTLSGLPS